MAIRFIIEKRRDVASDPDLPTSWTPCCWSGNERGNGHGSLTLAVFNTREEAEQVRDMTRVSEEWIRVKETEETDLELEARR